MTFDNPMQKHLIVQCNSCSGTGVYSGFAEPRGVGVVCLNCNGSGKMRLEYTEFEGRKKRSGINTVRRSAGSFIGTGVGPTGGSVSYDEFLNGKMP